jgi:hypothetical protein
VWNMTRMADFDLYRNFSKVPPVFLRENDPDQNARKAYKPDFVPAQSKLCALDDHSSDLRLTTQATAANPDLTGGKSIPVTLR